MNGFAEETSGGKVSGARRGVNRRRAQGRRQRGPTGRTLVRAAIVVGLVLQSGGLLAQGEADEQELVVRGLSFSGNHAIDDYTLSISIATSNSSFFARMPILRLLLGTKRYFDPQDFRRDVLRIQTLYRATGYVGVEVDTTVHRSDGSVSLEFRIREGEPVRIVSLSITGAENVVPQRRLRDRIPLQVGDPFNRLLIQASADTIRAAVRNRGYPYAEVFRNFDEDRENRTAEVRFEVDPGPFARVEAIELVGNQEYDDKVIRRVLSVREGQPFSQRVLDNSQLDLYRMGTFNYVSLALKDSVPDSPDDSLVTIQVQIAEGALRRIRLGAGYGTIDCFRTRSSWTLHNFLGDAQTLELNAQVSRIGAGTPLSAGFENSVCRGLRKEESDFLKLNFNVSATFRERFLFDRRTSATVSVSAERHSEFTAFLREAYGGDLSVTRQMPGRVPVSVTYSASYGMTDADLATFCTFLDVCDAQSAVTFTEFRLTSAVALGIVRDRTDSPLDPSRGTVLRADLRHASKTIGSDEQRQFTRGVVDFASHHRLGHRSVVSWRIRLGGVTAPRIDLGGAEPERFVPPEERFYGGGASSVRGFSQNELGPLVRVLERSLDTLVNGDTSFVTDSVIRTSPSGGEAVLVANAEYRFALSRRLTAALFVDAGQVFDREGDNPGLQVTPGAGLRLSSPIGPIRLDVGFNPYEPRRGPLFEVRDDPDTGEPDRILVQVDDDYAPGRSFFGRFRIHFSVGQAF